MGAVSWYRTWNHPIGCARLLCPTMALATMGSPISRISMASMLVRRWAIHSGWCKLKRSFRSDVSAPRCLESDRNRNIWSCQVLIQLEIRHFSTSPPTLIPQFAQRAQRLAIWGQQNNWFNQPQASGSTQQARVLKNPGHDSAGWNQIWCGQCRKYWCIEIINNIY